MPSILDRWKARTAIRVSLLAAARKRMKAKPSRLGVELVKRRKAEVAFAERVVARHTPKRPGVSQTGVSLIAGFEGCRLAPYTDSVGVWTIGYGHTEGVGPHTPPLASTRAAMNLLRGDLDRKYAPPVTALGLPLNQNQYDALVSFVYNLGPGVLSPSTSVGRALRARNWSAAADALLAYDHAGGQRLVGLTRRRQAERALFLRPVTHP